MPRLAILLVPAIVLYGGLTIAISLVLHQVSTPYRGILAAGGSVAVSLICIAAYRAAIRALERRDPAELRWKDAAATLPGFAIGTLLICSAQAVALALGAARFDGIVASWAPVIGLIVSLMAAVAEEILFRGILYRCLREAFGIIPAVSLSALVFGGLHLFNKGATVTSALAIAIEAGLMLSLAFEWSGALWLPIGIHLGWNYVEGPILGGAVSGFATTGLFRIASPGPALWTGGAFGLEASLQAVILGGATAALFALAIRRQRQR